MDRFAQRRQQFISAMGGQAAAIFVTGGERIRNATSHFRFRPESDFYYLTGFCEPDSVLVLTPTRQVIFLRPRDLEREVWNGRRLGVEAAPTQLGVDEAYAIESLADKLPGLLEGAETLHYRFSLFPDYDASVLRALHSLSQAKRRLTPSPRTIVDSSLLLHDQRIFKSEEELEIMRRSASISAEAHRLAMAYTRPGRSEHQIEALIEYTFRRHGASGPAYPSIVGGGENATILHYIENNCPLKDGELLLVDAGAELGFYAADITRTYPINGRFTPEQKDAYEIVLEAQRRAIAVSLPGRPYIDGHHEALRALTEGLVFLGFLSGDIDGLLEQKAYEPYYMHRTSHWLGLDVHDAGDYVRAGENRILAPGMIHTVEPGLYFGTHLPNLSAAFRGMGIRIEDDILITESGHEVLTHEAPKSIAALESLVGTLNDFVPQL